MTSSQPVVTPNAINFTPDNKRAYAYSGLTSVTDSNSILLEFQTNSEYIIAKWQPSYFSSGGTDAYRFTLVFNDIVIQNLTESNDKDGPYDLQQCIIPPFTKVKITCANVSDSSSNDVGVALIGQVFGMTDTGYQ